MEAYSVIAIAIVCITLLSGLFLVLLAIPTFRSFALQILGWGVFIICALLFISPIDFFPFPIPIDDFLIYLPTGVGAAIMALHQRKNGNAPTAPSPQPERKKPGRPRKQGSEARNQKPSEPETATQTEEIPTDAAI